jgi:chromosome segregation protein
MKLTRLRLVGFKSFADPTDFQIEPGLTGVVGPNGCGKSNLVEAIKWVMGESSFKSMRASSMDDVIFSGSSSRGARNNAEVAVRIDNSDRSAPAAFNDADILEIARRIDREGGSTYTINSREVRAHDVQVVFADACTGAGSPALVHQGRIGEIIQAKPEQRRHVLEEAAGIAGLRARRYEAELRIKATEANLLRLEDVIGQLADQVDDLKKRAREAARYRAVSAEVRKCEATLYHVRWTAAKVEVAEAEHAKDLCLRSVAQRTATEAEASKRQALVVAELPRLREAEARAGATVHRLNVARQELDREEERTKDRLAELVLQLMQLIADSEREQALAADAEAALARLTTEEETLRSEVEESAGRRSDIEAKVSQAEGELASAETILAALTAQRAELTAGQHQLETTVQEQGCLAVRLENEITEIARKRSELQASGSSAVLAALTAEVKAAEAALLDAEASVAQAEAAHALLRSELESTRKSLVDAEQRVQRLETEAKTLSEVLAVGSKNLLPPVIDSIAAEKGYEKALGAALGEDLDAPVAPSAPIRWMGSAIDASDPGLPTGVEPLLTKVRAPSELSRRLSQIGVVSREVGARLRGQLKPGQRLVSPEGDLWRWDGFSASAHAEASAARRLAERTRLAAIEAELLPARSEVEACRRVADAAGAVVEDVGAAEIQARNAVRELRRELNVARDQCEAVHRNQSCQAARLSALAEARLRLSASRHEAMIAKRQAEEELCSLTPVAELEGKLGAVRSDIAGKRVELDRMRADQDGIMWKANFADRRLAQLASDQGDWGERLAGARNQIATITTRVAEAERGRANLERAPQIFADKRSALLREVEGAEVERRICATRLDEAENALTNADRDARIALQEVGAAREELARAEEYFEGAKRQLSEIAREIHDMLQVEPSAVTEVAELKPGQRLTEVAEIEERLKQLRRERERLGPVNLRAEEELGEVEAQHSGLTAERGDLVEAITKLRLGIQTLNSEARNRLLVSFEHVNKHFDGLFAQLFGGGSAKLQLVDSDDPLEAGLEILVTPAGKPQSILSLLSGGEQALTALALIFAMFLTTPAPICVLDEAEAPLDDHNVERFCALLEEMTRATDTRFLIITHNPITMARMNRLFGVTMVERGVSQLVAVDLETAVRFRETG